MRLLSLILTQLTPPTVSSPTCLDAATLFWAEYYKNLPNLTARDEHTVIINWEPVIPHTLHHCVQRVELHQISISSVSRPLQYLDGTQEDQYFQIEVNHICSNSDQIFKLRFILVSNEWVDSKPFQYSPSYTLSRNIPYCYRDKVLDIRIERNIKPELYRLCYRGSFVEIRQEYTAMLGETHDTLDSSSDNVEKFVESVTKLVEITLMFTDPEDSRLKVRKKILMNITEEHCDDLGKLDNYYFDIILSATLIMMLLLFLVLIGLMVKKKNYTWHGTEVIAEINNFGNNQESLAL